jgi:hypothetical protein
MHPAACHDIIKSNTPPISSSDHESPHAPPVRSLFLSQDRTPFVFDNDFWKGLTRAQCDTALENRVAANAYDTCTRQGWHLSSLILFSRYLFCSQNTKWT